MYYGKWVYLPRCGGGSMLIDTSKAKSRPGPSNLSVDPYVNYTWLLHC